MLLPRLQSYGLAVDAVIEQGRYIALDAAETLSTVIVNDRLDSARFLELAGYLITSAAKAAPGEYPRVSLCGECDPPLWTLGNGEAAIRVEQLWNEVIEKYDVDILCGYSVGGLQGVMNNHIIQRICAEHSAVVHSP